MFDFEFLPARHGDSILVRWGAGRTLLVDGGPDRVYEDVLRPRLLQLPKNAAGQRIIDLLVLSHVDDDHIVGVQQLLKELARAKRDQLEAPFTLKRVWFNSVDELVDQAAPGTASALQQVAKASVKGAAVAASYAQGRDVRSHLLALGLSGNPPFNSIVKADLRCEVDGLEVRVIGPTSKAIDRLVKKWKASVKNKDPTVVAAAYIDRSVPNLSSIALHLKHGDRTALLTGDARGDDLLKGLEAGGLLAKDAVLEVDVFKLPHHGSENNAEPSLFERIKAEHYIVSADGIKHEHPSPATLDWLVDSRQPNDEYVIHLTMPIPEAIKQLESLQQTRRFKVLTPVAIVRL